jgi:D-3-phosphoglycerate dehydrogenase
VGKGIGGNSNNVGQTFAHGDVRGMKKIVVACAFGIDEQALSLLGEVAQITLIGNDPDVALAAEIRDADAVLVGPRPYVNRSLIESATRLKHIARVGVGLDNIDMQAATERGIIVTNTPDVTADSVAEFTMSLLLSLAKNIPRCDRAVRENKWNERHEISRANIELNGKTHGIVGLGRIGRRVAVRCRAFGMRILYYKRSRDGEFEKSAGVQYVPFETLLKESDSISLHIPLTTETANLFDQPQFESMKRTALLINQSRGKVVNESALIQALKDGRIGGYATDVYEDEPPDPENPLLRFKNVVVTPHVGGGTRESGSRISMVVAEDVVKVIKGDIPENVVNKEVLQNKPF